MSESLCLSCNLTVSNRHQAVLCDGCERWCHRKCGTGISQAEYREAVRNEQDIVWMCGGYTNRPVFQPNRLQSTPEYLPGE